MPTRYSDEWYSREWPYPVDLDGFLDAIRADRDDDYDTRMRVEIFLATHVGRRMLRELREALTAAGLVTRSSFT